ncbi:tripartite tricarboxylate transporter substrate binding protein [Pigmentiphaga sp. H8]|uniref:Bug family tripartite tricarboxylate transporter substrate binding protein n=1 Tax=Pigmentiphaga sp. H8 TaxID=2488560 RepID=UPI000F5929F2|nr:tripartite tricarboxylate transporter substrate binding protein [Pigmentiphaga sp. H8]AZG09958.1 tripartite tricarboxylate transporter substrate binding protein [Pigmentiphaga sp. H8]
MTSAPHAGLRRGLQLLLAVVGLAWRPALADEPFPSKPITVIVSLQAGSASDIATRVVAGELSKRLGVKVIVENLPGAGGVLGASRLHGAKPDGYTLAALNNGLITFVPNLPDRPSFDIGTLAAVSMIAELPSVLVVPAALPASTLREFVDYSRQHPGKLSYGSVGMGSPQHIAMEMLKSATGADLLHVPYRGGPQAVADVVSGQIQATWIAVSVAVPFIKTGQLRPLAVGGGTRSPQLPDTPTLKEAGVREFEYVPWVGLYAPPNTPAPVLRVLSEAVQGVLDQKASRDQIAGYGLRARASSPAELQQVGQTERGEMAAVIEGLRLR